MILDNKKLVDFIIILLLFVLNLVNENLLRIMYIGVLLVKDREIFFFISVWVVFLIMKWKEGNILKIVI